MANSKTFEDCLGEIAADVNLLLDGEYEPLKLMKDLTLMLQARRGVPISPGALPTSVPLGRQELIKDATGNVDIKPVDTDMLRDFGESFGTLSEQERGKGPYTICDNCTTSFDCITERSCKLGTPAVQLERTMEVLEKFVVDGKRRN